MKIDEVKDMLPQKPERMESVEEPKKSELVKASYDVIGCILEVYKQLGSGLPEYIYQEAFANCNGLKSVKSLAATPPFLYENSFSNYEIPLSVPEGARDTYLAASPWNKFKEILSGKYDSIPENAFLYCGSIEEVVAKAKEMEAK